MKKYCSIYVRNQFEGASCYYRIIQYINIINIKHRINDSMTRRMFRRNLDNKNEYIKVFMQIYFYIIMLFRISYYLVRDIINRPDYVIIQRTIIPKHSPVIINIMLEMLCKKTTVYWDYDDDIFINGEITKKQAEILFKYANKIVVTSEYLKGKVEEKYKSKVIILCTTDGDFQGIDIKKINEKRKELYSSEIRLVWVATSANIPSIDNIIPELEIAAKEMMEKKGKQLSLFVVCNKALLHKTKYLKIININWTRKNAIDTILTSHIGIMPLLHVDYSLGKGGFKLIQYIATGLPVIGSKIGYNINIVNDRCGILINDEISRSGWINALEKITASWEIWEEYSFQAYSQWNKKFSFYNNLMIWNRLFKIDY